MTSFGRLISHVNSGASAIAGLLVILMVLHVTLDVLMRFVFEMPLDATILYVSAFYMVAIAFLPLGLVEEHGSHISVELLVEMLPSRVQSALVVFALILTAITTAAVAVRTGQEAYAKYATGAYSIEAGGKIITWPTYLYLPVGFGLMSIVAAWRAIAKIAGRDSGLSILRVEDPYLPENHPDV